MSFSTHKMRADRAKPHTQKLISELFSYLGEPFAVLAKHLPPGQPPSHRRISNLAQSGQPPHILAEPG